MNQKSFCFLLCLLIRLFPLFVLFFMHAFRECRITLPPIHLKSQGDNESSNEKINNLQPQCVCLTRGIISRVWGSPRQTQIETKRARERANEVKIYSQCNCNLLIIFPSASGSQERGKEDQLNLISCESFELSIGLSCSLIRSQPRRIIYLFTGPLNGT